MGVNICDESTIKSVVFEDNNGDLWISKWTKITPITKQIAKKYNWFRDQIGENKGIVL